MMSRKNVADGYIPARKAELAQKIAEHAGDPALPDVFKLLTAILHFEAHDELEGLKALYDPLDPDAPDSRRNDDVGAFERFETDLIEALARANFTEIEHSNVRTLAATQQLTGLSIKPSLGGIRRIRYFARGAHPQTIEVKTWLGLRKTKLDVDMMRDVVVLVGFKSATEIGRDDRITVARMRRGVRPGAALVKHFRNVAMPELVTLHPGARPSMLRRDQVFLAAPAVAGGVPLALNLWPALTVIFALLAAYFGAGHAISNDELRRALAASSGLLAVGAFMMRQRMKFETQSLRYQKQLADTVYFRNLANNAGVLDLLVGAGEEQDAKEAMLAYALLLRAPMGRADIDAAAETFLRDQMQLEVNFEIQDALAKLERLGLVTHSGDTYSAVPPAQARAQLDAAWDGYFKFST